MKAVLRSIAASTGALALSVFTSLWWLLDRGVFTIGLSTVVDDAGAAPDKVVGLARAILNAPGWVPAVLFAAFFAWWSWTVWSAFRALDVPVELKSLLATANEGQARYLRDIESAQTQAREASQKVFDWERIGTLQFHALPQLTEFRRKLGQAKEILLEGVSSVATEADLVALTNRARDSARGAFPEDNGNYPMRMGWYFPQRPPAEMRDAFKPLGANEPAPKEDVLTVGNSFIFRSTYASIENADRLWTYFEERTRNTIAELYPPLAYA